jgi:ubiquinone/menaquinone biosynthesis C-methylase UbiE
MELAIGGNYETLAPVLAEIVRSNGLEPWHSLVDVGCGSGRLAFGLRDYLLGDYLGTDVVPKLLEYAAKRCGRPSWKFRSVDSLTIPAPDRSANMVSFFSVLTHLLHEDCYRYLVEARRVLKPAGKILFSFLEFHVPAHWAVFDAMLEDSPGPRIHCQFISRDAIESWANHLGMKVETITDGSLPLGQSLCVLQA